jgi:hypothetical protein
VIIPAGNFTYDPESRKMEADSVFDIASVTKSIPTSSLALKLLEKGKIRLEDKLSDFLPVSENPEMEPVTMVHLLTHTLDWGFRLAEMKEKPREEIIAALFSAKFRSAPEQLFFTRMPQASFSARNGKDYGTVWQARSGCFFLPSGMSRTTFRPLEILEREEIVRRKSKIGGVDWSKAKCTTRALGAKAPSAQPDFFLVFRTCLISWRCF